MKARIFKPSKTAMQSGRGKAKSWMFEYECGERVPESLMGWTSSNDTLNQVLIPFKSLDDAKAFADSKGIAYTVSMVHERKIKPRNYADGFRYIPPEDK